MRPPTPLDIKKWATTPIRITSTIEKDKHGMEFTKNVWHRTTTLSGCVEQLEGDPRDWFLERVGKTKTYTLIGVSE